MLATTRKAYILIYLLIRCNSRTQSTLYEKWLKLLREMIRLKLSTNNIQAKI